MTSVGRFSIHRLGPGRAGDFRAIRLAALAGAPGAFGSTHATEASRPIGWFEDRTRTSAVFGAYSGERIVGMAGFVRETGPKDSHKGVLWGMFVEPAARGQGVGAALVDAVLEHAASLVEQVTLAVAATNAPSLALYRGAGFTSYGVEPRALKVENGYEDEVLMIRFLGSRPAWGA